MKKEREVKIKLLSEQSVRIDNALKDARKSTEETDSDSLLFLYHQAMPVINKRRERFIRKYAAKHEAIDDTQQAPFANGYANFLAGNSFMAHHSLTNLTEPNGGTLSRNDSARKRIERQRTLYFSRQSTNFLRSDANFVIHE